MMIFLISFNLFSCNVQVAHANPLLILEGVELGQVAIATIIGAGTLTVGSKLDADDWDYIGNSTAQTWNNLSSSVQDEVVSAYKTGKKITGKTLNSILDTFNALPSKFIGNWNINAPISYPSSSNTFQGVSVGRTVTIGGDVFTIQEIGTADFLGSKYVIKVNNVLAQNQTKYRFTGTTDNINSQTAPFFIFQNDQYCGVNYLDLRVVKSEWGQYSDAIGFTHIDSQAQIEKPKTLVRTANLQKIQSMMSASATAPQKVWEEDKDYAIPPSTTLEKIQNKEEDISIVKIDNTTKDIVTTKDIPSTGADTKADWTWWQWLKDWCSSFFKNLFEGLGNLLKSLFVPRDAFLKNQFDALNATLSQKLDTATYVELVKGWRNILNPKFEGIRIHGYMFWRGDALIVSPEFINNSLDFIHKIIKGFLFPLLILYNYSQVYRLIRGNNYVSTDNGRDNKTVGGGKK